MIKAIIAQHGLFTERAEDIYSFSHLTFHEYFYAQAVMNDPSGNSLRKLLTPGNITQDRWREAIKFAASLPGRKDYFFKLFQEALDGLIAEEPKLEELLAWTQVKAANCGYQGKIGAARAGYLALARDRTRALALALALALARQDGLGLDIHLVNLWFGGITGKMGRQHNGNRQGSSSPARSSGRRTSCCCACWQRESEGQ